MLCGVRCYRLCTCVRVHVCTLSHTYIVFVSVCTKSSRTGPKLFMASTKTAVQSMPMVATAVPNTP